MASGTITWWCGHSGWIKQTGVEDEPTVDANDIMVLPEDVTSGTVTTGATVTFDIDTTTPNPWRARNVVGS